MDIEIFSQMIGVLFGGVAFCCVDVKDVKFVEIRRVRRVTGVDRDLV